MLGYWKDEENTKKMIDDDGWLKTGDQLSLREDGYAVIVGRLKDMIIRGGENIFPKVSENNSNFVLKCLYKNYNATLQNNLVCRKSKDF